MEDDQDYEFKHKFFEWQVAHLSMLLILLTALIMVSVLPPIRAGSFLGVSTIVWFWVAVFAPIAHQIYVWIMWRLELYEKALSKRFDDPFKIFSVFFKLLGLSRFLIIPLAIANQGTITLNPVLQWGLSALFIFLSGYLFYSVIRWFSLKRAMGFDHFIPEVARDWKMVDKGMFKYSSNAMYTFGFLLLWAIAIMFESSAALIIAAFNHLYIWVHYYCTEKPDMDFIYGEG
ncbi:MAG: methyltransferase [Balneolaceae bacterium]